MKPVYSKPTTESSQANAAFHKIFRDDRLVRTVIMQDIAFNIGSLLGMSPKTLAMIIEREEKNNVKYPSEERNDALAIFSAFADNRDKFVAALQKRGYKTPVFA